MFFSVLCLALPIWFWYLQHKISHSMDYQVSDYFHFMSYKNFSVNVAKVFLIELPDFPLNFSPKKLCHTIWLIISKIDIFCQVLENNWYSTLNCVLYTLVRTLKMFFAELSVTHCFSCVFLLSNPYKENRRNLE